MNDLSKMMKRMVPTKQIEVKELSGTRYPSPVEPNHVLKNMMRRLTNVNISKPLPKNPFNLPWNMRVFHKGTRKRKVHPEPFIMTDPKTICEIDSEFYKVIEGRPIRSFIDIKVYMQDIRNIVMTKANFSYQIADLVLQIDTAMAEELKEYNSIYNLYQDIKASFVRFAQESYDAAKACQQVSLDKAKQVDIAIDTLNGFSFTFNKLRNEVDNLIAILKTLSLYGQFLYTVAPLTWKEIHRAKFARNKSVSLKIFASDMCLPSGDLQYDVIIPFLKDDKAEIYFKNPKQIIDIFDEISKQCLNYMQMDVFTSNLLSSVFRRRDYLKAVLKHETEEIEEIIAMNKINILYLELKELECKTKFDRILVNEFQNLFASYDASKLFTCLQYVHTQIFATPEDPKDSISSLAFNLEVLYVQLTSKLDDLDQEVVKKSTQELFAEDIRIMKQAHLAQRNLRECAILTKCLYTSFEPPRRRIYKHT